MKLKLKVIMTLTILCAGVASEAKKSSAKESSCLVNSEGEILRVSQLALYLDSSLQPDMSRIVESAVSSVNRDKGRAVFVISGSSSGVSENDGLSTVSLSSDFSNHERSTLIRTSARWGGGDQLVEVDLVINSNAFHTSPAELRQKIAEQLNRLVCE